MPVTLEAIQRNSSQQLNTFTGFYLTVEKDFTDTNLVPLRPIDIKNMENSVGRFEMVPEEPAAKISDRCNNLVTHTTTVAVQSVQVSATCYDEILHKYCYFFLAAAGEVDCARQRKWLVDLFMKITFLSSQYAAQHSM